MFTDLQGEKEVVLVPLSIPDPTFESFLSLSLSHLLIIKLLVAVVLAAYPVDVYGKGLFASTVIERLDWHGKVRSNWLDALLTLGLC